MVPLLRALRAVALPLLVVVLWELLAWAGFQQGKWPSLLFVVLSLGAEWQQIVSATRSTVCEVLIALGVGVAIGTPAGLLLASIRSRVSGLYSMCAGLKAVPVTILVPTFLALFGLEDFVIPLVALPIVLNLCVNTAQAIEQASTTRMLLLRSWNVPRNVYITNILPYECLDSLLQTCRIVLPFALALHIALDYFYCIPEGLGCYVNQRYERYEYGGMYAATLVVGMLGLGVGKGIDLTSRRLLKWKRDM